MSIGIQIDILDTGARAALARLDRGLAPQSLNPIIGRAGVNCVRDYLFALDNSRPNKNGWPRTHYYAAAARSTQYGDRIARDGVEIAVNEVGMGQRFRGGPIDPVNSMFLTIPARAEAYGHRAREFYNLKFGFARNRWGVMQPALIEALSQDITIKKRKGKRKIVAGKEHGTIADYTETEPMFWLARHVDQKPDPNVLPTEEELMGEVAKSTASYINRIIGRSGGNS